MIEPRYAEGGQIMFTTSPTFKIYGLLLISLITWNTRSEAGEYESMKRCQKFQKIWVQGIKTSTYKKLPRLSGSFSDLLGLLKGPSQLKSTFTRTSDYFAKPRKKLLHPFGSVVGLRFERGAHNLSGLFSDSHECVLARLSLAGDPNLIGFTPGLALKFFIDGHPSRNIMVMNSLDGQGNNHDFFSRSFSNVLPKPRSFALRFLERIFAQVKENPRQLDIQHLLTITKTGRKTVSALKGPVQLILRPKLSLPKNPRTDFRIKLSQIPKGTVLYDVYLRQANAEVIPVGRLRTITHFAQSAFADQQLFFKHQK